MKRKSSIDIGLAVLCAIKPGVPLSRSAIASACDCSEERIREIEERALRKLRNPCRLKLITFGRN